jgi:hypothetical protein
MRCHFGIICPIELFFQYPGQFAKAYKALFHDLPSQTLAVNQSNGIT